jgi:hypothetical protein
MSDRIRDPPAVVGLLADALDSDEFAAVERLVAADCQYTVGGTTHQGRDAVLAAYRQGSSRAHELFDAVVFSHRAPEEIRPGAFRVDFVDELTYGGDTLIHHSIQHIIVGADGDVVEIVDVTGAQERANVEAFLTRHGLQR